MRRFTGAMCCLFLLCIVYVWQHLGSIEAGYSVEAQKVQVEQMRETNRQLRLSEAQLSDPGRIDTIAKAAWVWVRRCPGRWCGRMGLRCCSSR